MKIRSRLLAAGAVAILLAAPLASQQAGTASAARAGQQTTYRVGERVQVSWHGTWFPATVLEVGTGSRAGTYKIRYTGYDASWDEFVGPGRIARAEGAAPGPDGGTGTAGGTLVPEGRYVCQSFEAGQLHNQGEFILQAGGTYRDPPNRSAGRWTHDRATGRMQFTGGSLQNRASARLVRTSQGKTAVEFTWSGGANRFCYKQSR